MGVYNKILEQVADGTTHVDLGMCLHCIEMGNCEKKGSEYEGMHWVDVVVDQLKLKGE